MIDALVTGKLYGRAAERIDKAGKTYLVARVLAPNEEGETFFVNAIVFSPALRAIVAALDDGDSLVVGGAITPRVWVDKQGLHRPSLDMVVTHAVSTRALPPAHPARQESDNRYQ